MYILHKFTKDYIFFFIWEACCKYGLNYSNYSLKSAYEQVKESYPLYQVTYYNILYVLHQTEVDE